MLILLGALLLLIGALFYLMPRFPFLEKIPGNIRWQKGPVTVYFPLGTCIVISLLLSLLLHFWSRR
jgi:hypothetical protein